MSCIGLEESSTAWEVPTVGDLLHATRRPVSQEAAHAALMLADMAPTIRLRQALRQGVARRMGLVACERCLATGELVADEMAYTMTPCSGCEGWGYTTKDAT
jgi:hypothetical protein